MKQEVLFIILNEYADWESAFLAASLHSGLMPGSEIKYVVKTVAPLWMQSVPWVVSVLCRTTVLILCPPIMLAWS